MAENSVADKEQAPKYDEGYKDILSNKDMFLHFLKKYIAAPWTENISSDDLEKVDTSFTTDELKHLESDLIYKLKINGSDVYFYVLVELQSSVDFTMPFRLLKYMVKLLDQIFQNTDKNERERKGFRLPAVVPIILYNGYDIWTVVRAFREYTENGDIFGNSIINFEYLLFDLKRTDEEMILSTKKLLDVIFALDKNRLDKHDGAAIAERLDKLIPELTEDDFSSLFKWMKYVYLRGKMSSIIEKTFKESISKKGDVGIMKHAIEVMLEERDKDVEVKAMERKATVIAKNLLAKGMKPVDVAEATGLMIDNVLRLQS